MSARVAIQFVASLLLALTVGTAHAQSVPVQQEGENQKRAQSGMKFVQQSISPKAAALGNAVTSLEMGSASVFYNPSALSRMEGFGHLTAGQIQWIGDITHSAASVAIQPSGGQYGVVGLSFRSVDYGDFERTRRADNDAGYVQMGTYSPSGLEMGITYARSVTDRFSVGGSVKYVRQNLGTGSVGLTNGSVESREYSLSTSAYDFGVMYDPGFHSLRFAMSARNFSPAIEFVEESFELPLALNVGVSMDVLDFAGASVTETHDLLVTVDTAHPRDYSETVSVGGEYSFMDVLSLRAGYTTPSDEAGLSLGGGLHYDFNGLALNADYAYTNMGIFGDVNRIGLGIGF